MNFTHFVPTGENLTPDIIPELCHDLLRRSAALQLSWNQPTYDKLIPFYCGTEDETVDVSKCGVILVQDKNKQDASSLDDIFPEDFMRISPGTETPSKYDAKESIRNGPKFVFNDMKNPILYLLLDMGVPRSNRSGSPAVQVCCSHDGQVPQMWAIHSQGNDETVFRCLKLMDCVKESKMFFASTVSSGRLHDELAGRNRIFHRLHRRYRYSSPAGVTEGNVEETRDGTGDTPMGDA